MISAKSFIADLASHHIRFLSGVPCSFFKSVYLYVETLRDFAYVMAPNEGAALTVASGAALNGQASAVLIQNSGLGNLINPLTSLNMIYRVPVAIFVSGRAYEVPDEPQHEIMGRTMKSLIASLGLQSWDLPQETEACSQLLDHALEMMHKRREPVIFFIKKDTFEDFRSEDKGNSYPMTRLDAISVIQSFFQSSDAVFSTTGMPSRELFAVSDRPGNFYMQGSMGHIAAIALGYSLAHPESRIWVLDGDGAFLMHMGIPSMIGHYQPKHFLHIILDNEAYETTGNQKTTSATTDFPLVAKACGYHDACEVSTENDLKERLGDYLLKGGIRLIRVKINSLITQKTPRITTKYKADQITDQFSRFAQS